MPNADTISKTLSTITQEQRLIAIAWHVALALAFSAWGTGARPSRSLVSALLALPLASVSALAWLYGNAWNGVVFLALCVLLLVDAASRTGARAPAVSRTSAWIGAAMIAFAAIYPHFLANVHAAGEYLYASPLGLIPCPTLSLVLGAGMVGVAPVRRRSAIALALAGVFYGAFGVLRLGVWIDVVLLSGAVAFAVHIYSPHQRASVHSTLDASHGVRSDA